MRITVRLFAILKDRAGTAEVLLELPEGASVADAEAAILIRHPSAADLFPRVAFAVNREYVRRDAMLADGDELAVIPPVSGG